VLAEFERERKRLKFLKDLVVKTCDHLRPVAYAVNKFDSSQFRPIQKINILID